MDRLEQVSAWARASIVPLVAAWVIFLIGVDIVTAALAPEPIEAGAAAGTVSVPSCKIMPDSTRICDFPPPGNPRTR